MENNTVTMTVTMDKDIGGIRDLLEHYNADHIRKSLLELPAKIVLQKLNIRKAWDAFKEADLPREIMEIEFIDDITAEKDPGTGKARFSNEKSRENELKKRKTASAEYQELVARAREAERELNSAEDDLEYLENRFKAYRYVSALVSSELSVMASGLAEEWPMEEIRSLGRVDGRSYDIPSGDSKINGQPY